MAMKKSDTDRQVQSRPKRGWEMVEERHRRVSAVSERKVDALNRAREIVNNLGGEAQTKNLDNRFIGSNTQGRRDKSPAKDLR
jgi:hypothetical protein